MVPTEEEIAVKTTAMVETLRGRVSQDHALQLVRSAISPALRHGAECGEVTQ
mgnify:CR=1 FL=1